MIKFNQKGNFNKIETFCKKMKHPFYYSKLDAFGRKGVEALSLATPKNTCKTANSWSYEILTSGNKIKIIWKNSNLAEEGMPIALLIQYGHMTNNKGYVEGYDYINPALRPIFDEMANSIWKEVTEA